jgi:hypothetical protein
MGVVLAASGWGIVELLLPERLEKSDGPGGGGVSLLNVSSLSR